MGRLPPGRPSLLALVTEVNAPNRTILVIDESARLSEPIREEREPVAPAAAGRFAEHERVKGVALAHVVTRFAGAAVVLHRCFEAPRVVEVVDPFEGTPR